MHQKRKFASIEKHKLERANHAVERKNKNRRTFSYVLLCFFVVAALGWQALALSECNSYLSKKNVYLKNITREFESEKIELENKLSRSNIYAIATSYGMRKADNSQYIIVQNTAKASSYTNNFIHNIKTSTIYLYNSIKEYFIF
ncbi:hypothetical protein [Treponema sp. R6D11]